MSKSKSRQPSKPVSAEVKSTAKLATDASADTTEKQIPATPKNAPAASSMPPVHRPQTRDAAKYERRQAERQQRFLAQRRARRIRNSIIAAIIFVVVATAGGFSAYFFYYAPHSKAQTTTPGAPFTEAIYNTDYQPIDNVYCDQLEGQVQHIHAVLKIYINGQESPLPANLGIETNAQSGQATCFYWLHTHDSSGVVHIESPAVEPFTVGQLVDEWNQQFNSLGFPTELLLSNGWTIWVNGHKYNGSLSSVPLDAHNIITIAYNSPNVKPLTTYNWGTL